MLHLVLINISLIHRRKTHDEQNNTPVTKKLEFNGPYDITISGTNPSSTTNDSTTHINQTFAPDSIEQSNADIYQTIQTDDEYAYAYADSGAQPNPNGTTDDSTYTNAEMAPRESVSQRKDNATFAGADNTEAGWEDNTIYATSSGDGDNQSAARDTEGWTENDIYGE